MSEKRVTASMGFLDDAIVVGRSHEPDIEFSLGVMQSDREGWGFFLFIGRTALWLLIGRSSSTWAARLRERA